MPPLSLGLSALIHKDSVVSLILKSLIHNHLISGMIVISLKIPVPSKVPCLCVVFLHWTHKLLVNFTNDYKEIATH